MGDIDHPIRPLNPHLLDDVAEARGPDDKTVGNENEPGAIGGRQVISGEEPKNQMGGTGGGVTPTGRLSTGRTMINDNAVDEGQATAEIGPLPGAGEDKQV